MHLKAFCHTQTPSRPLRADPPSESTFEGKRENQNSNFYRFLLPMNSSDGKKREMDALITLIKMLLCDFIQNRVWLIEFVLHFREIPLSILFSSSHSLFQRLGMTGCCLHVLLHCCVSCIAACLHCCVSCSRNPLETTVRKSFCRISFGAGVAEEGNSFDTRPPLLAVSAETVLRPSL